MEYRRRRNGDTWHWCSNCSKYPQDNFEKRHTKPITGKFCEECIIRSQNRNCRN